jgi:hypothetical protein
MLQLQVELSVRYSMRRIRVVGALLGLSLACGAHAQTIDLSVTGVDPYAALDITSSFNATIASITESWITGAGSGHSYTLSVRSSNGGLTHSTQSSSSIPYTLSYAGSNGQSISISTTDQQIGSRSIAKDVPGASATAALSMAYTGIAPSMLYQGVYGDILTFTLRKSGAGGNVTVTRTLSISATPIGSSLAINLSVDSIASSLPLTTSQTDLSLGTAYETSNSATGYRVLMRSQNGGFLKHSSAGSSPSSSQKIPYSFKYASTTATLSPANTNATVKTVAAGIYNNSSSALAISYTAPGLSSVEAGNYSDILTFTVEAQ